MTRREFPAKVKVAAFERAKGHCEKCGARLVPGKIRYDHILPDWMGGAPTLENCQAVCTTCDAPKTAADQGDIAKVKRIQAKHIGAKRSTWRSKWKRKMDGSVVLR
jgi:5-methylcytosine-specific restriction enzyme A